MNIQNIPKIELHCHLDGSIRPSTLFELASDLGLALNMGFDAFEHE